MPEKSVLLKDIGAIKFRKNKKSKNIRISIHPVRGVLVTLPFYVSYKYALRFVESKKEWILKHLAKVTEFEKNVTIYDENTNFKSKYRKLIIKKHTADDITTKITSDSILIKYPMDFSAQEPNIQAIIKDTIVEALRIEAKYYLPSRIKFFSDIYNFKYKKVFIKNNKTLWGSCSAVNNINLNLHLMRLPDHLIDYVILHELCHTVEKNHGVKFWQLLNSILGDAKKISKELKTYTTQIY